MLHYRLHRDPRSSHQQILRLVRRLGRGPILDVGAAQGILGQLLHEAGVQVEIDAVEPNPVWAEHAQPFYRRVQARIIEEADLPDGTYNTVVCADVLEHLPDPVGALKRLRQAATDDATFIISAAEYRAPRGAVAAAVRPLPAHGSGYPRSHPPPVLHARHRRRDAARRGVGGGAHQRHRHPAR
ncbi:MAG: class I SAM-dependent methyltransferase [Chloroflexia bacterium]